MNRGDGREPIFRDNADRQRFVETLDEVYAKTGWQVQAFMASNEIPKSYDPLVELLEDAADGAHQHEVADGLKQNTEAAIRADLAALIGTPAGPGGVPPAVPGLKALWNTAKANKTAKTAALRTVQSNGRTYWR